MRVAFWRVKEEIADSGSRDMLMLWSNVCEPNARGNILARPVLGSSFEVRFPQIWEAEEPENGLGHLVQDT